MICRFSYMKVYKLITLGTKFKNLLSLGGKITMFSKFITNHIEQGWWHTFSSLWLKCMHLQLMEVNKRGRHAKNLHGWTCLASGIVMEIHLPRGQNPIFGVHLTWAAVNTCWVSTCSGDLPAQLLGGLPCQYFAGKNGSHFSKWPPCESIIEEYLRSCSNGTSFHQVWGIILKGINLSTRWYHI